MNYIVILSEAKHPIEIPELLKEMLHFVQHDMGSDEIGVL